MKNDVKSTRQGTYEKIKKYIPRGLYKKMSEKYGLSPEWAYQLIKGRIASHDEAYNYAISKILENKAIVLDSEKKTKELLK